MSSIGYDNGLAVNEIKVKANSGLARYVKYALNCFRRNERSLVMKGAGTATSKVLHLTEILKRRVGDLHQTNRLYSVEVDGRKDRGNEEGKRRMSVFEIVLSLDPLDSDNIGYQEPIPKENIQRQPQRRYYQGRYERGDSRFINHYRQEYRGYNGYQGYRYGPRRFYRDQGIFSSFSLLISFLGYDQEYEQGYYPRNGYRGGYRGGFRGGRRGGYRPNYDSPYSQRNYQNQWNQERHPRFDTMSQGPPQR